MFTFACAFDQSDYREGSSNVLDEVTPFLSIRG